MERFDDALAGAGNGFLKTQPVFLSRDKAFLNWRYLSNPTGRHHCFGAYRESAPVGYMVMETGGGRSYLVDLVAEDEEAWEDLLATAVAAAQELGGDMLHTMALEGGRFSRRLISRGFRCLPRGGLLPFMIKTALDARPAVREKVTDARRWYLAHGDRDDEHLSN